MPRKGFLKVALKRPGGPAQFALPGGADDLVDDVEEPVQPETAAVPDPDAAVAVAVAEMLQRVVGGFDRLAPGAEQRLLRAHARSKRATLTRQIITVYV